MEVTLEERPAPAVESAIYFTIAESLTNVAKHAGATVASVLVQQRNGSVRLEVRDDGCGGAIAGTGSGLQGLEDRVAALGGRLELQSPPGAGTVLQADVPLTGKRGRSR